MNSEFVHTRHIRFFLPVDGRYWESLRHVVMWLRAGPVWG